LDKPKRSNLVFIAEVRALRIELEAERARLRAVMRAIEAERDHGVLQ
jgi:hypothetical protein